MELFDTHCHIQSAGLTEGERMTREIWAKDPSLTRNSLVEQAAANDVTRMICVGCDINDSRLAIDCAKDRPQCWAAIGVHPHEAANQPLQQYQRDLSALVHEPKVVAIGECGLDYFYEHSPRADQLKLLQFQLELAIEADLPVIFHVREAFDDFWPLFDSFPAGSIRGVLHSFTDSQANLDKAIERGLYIGVNGILTFVKQHEQLKVYAAIPPEQLLFETDSPFLTPVPFRGKVNEPKQIRTVAAAYSELTKRPFDELAQITTRNARTLFGV